MEGMKTIKSFSMEIKNIESFHDISNDESKKYVDATKKLCYVRFIFDLGSVIVLSVLVFILVGIMSIPVAELLLLIFLFVRMIPRFSIIQRSYEYFIIMFPAFETVISLEKECLTAAEPAMLNEEINFKNSIKLEGMSFRYSGEENKFALKILL